MKIFTSAVYVSIATCGFLSELHHQLITPVGVDNELCMFWKGILMSTAKLICWEDLYEQLTLVLNYKSIISNRREIACGKTRVVGNDVYRYRETTYDEAIIIGNEVHKRVVECIESFEKKLNLEASKSLRYTQPWWMRRRSFVKYFEKCREFWKNVESRTEKIGGLKDFHLQPICHIKSSKHIASLINKNLSLCDGLSLDEELRFVNDHIHEKENVLEIIDRLIANKGRVDNKTIGKLCQEFHKEFREFTYDVKPLRKFNDYVREIIRSKAIKSEYKFTEAEKRAIHVRRSPMKRHTTEEFIYTVLRRKEIMSEFYRGIDDSFKKIGKK